MHADVLGPDDAPDVVCLHGGIGTGQSHWGKQGKALAEAGWRVHLVDLPGHGSTPLDEDADYGRDLLVASVRDYLGGLGAPAHILGFSMGGHTTLALLADDPPSIASVALVGVSLREHDGLEGWRKHFDPDVLADEQPLWARYLSKVHAPLGGPDAWKDVCRRDSAGMAVAVDTDALAAYGAPALLIRGDADPTVDPRHFAELRDLWPQAHEQVVPAGAHDVQLTRYEHVALSIGEHLEATR